MGENGTGEGSDEHGEDARAPLDDEAIALAHELIGAIEADLAAIEAALDQLERGEYGRCEVCGAPIDPQRLEAEPACRRCDAHREVADG